ncbi:F0F1 ATP synthase subunit gamma [Massilia agilis]|uniref:ATP synthase gamma chain n=1 Tax=Massilia agilis TaxID=1811226 RepID=A0ABT2DBT1_9BURK|nr:F0F1 ATP synthase subunit gamma [Massilia agilis]MCS0808721.1 F0F1 ATP synthase subunit gamma [Massilia agilis]
MAGFKDIRTKIRSVENTRKITKAMEMVAASKMRRAQERMRSARPYADKVRRIAGHLAEANPEYRHPFIIRRDEVKNAGLVVVTTDKGLCGGMNTNILRNLVARMRELDAAHVGVSTVAIGNKGLGFLNRIGARVVAQAAQLGDTPHLSRLIGPIKVLLDAYFAGEIDEVHIFYTRFVNSMTQVPVAEQLVPLTPEKLRPELTTHSWEYIYEPDPQTVIDDLLQRYVEAMIYRAVAENMASEQSARRMAMKAASDNAGNVIGELNLLYNKNRQAAITKEISEIVSGAAAV